MRKLLKGLCMILGIPAAFAGFVFLILTLQGRLSKVSIKGMFKKEVKTSEKTAPFDVSKKSSKKISFSLPAPFNFEEVSKLVKALKETKANYEKKLKALEIEKEILLRIRQDVEERKKDIRIMTEKLEVLASELKQRRKNWEQQKLQSAKEEQKNLKKLAKMFEGMDVEQAAERLGQMEEANSAKILHLMRTRSASKVLSNLPPDKVKKIAQLMKKRIPAQ